jgi:GT2 family glycosyltransferase
MSYSVVILSKDGDKAKQCVAAVRAMQPDLPGRRIIVVDDGIDIRSALVLRAWGVSIVTGDKPFVFARNANYGILTAHPDDLVLLNDDALLETEFGFNGLAHLSKAKPEYGVLASVTDSVGNRNQFAKGTEAGNLIDEPRMVCFICVYIPRRTIDLIGGLDERFDGYGWEDNAYCELVKRAGLKLGIYTGCFVNHTKLKSSFRGEPGAQGDRAAFLRGQEIFEKYYGGHT